MTEKSYAQRLSEQPIRLPGSPFWNICKTFGRDEILALIINVICTAIAGIFITSTIVLAIIGPVIEKLGFFPAHIKSAYDVYKTTVPQKRRKLTSYIRDAMKGSSQNLLRDILMHDPIYIILFYLGAMIYPFTPVWILSTVSFLLAILAVAAIEVINTEVKYILFKRKLRKAGYNYESYIESRFFISAKINPDRVLEKIAKEFNLQKTAILSYEDIYIDNSFPEFSGRKAFLRLRKRTRTNKKGFNSPGWIQTAQIVYTRAEQHEKESLDQYRYFPIRKEKLYFVLDQQMPATAEQIKDQKIKKVTTPYAEQATQKVSFQRVVARNDEILISADKLINQRDFYLVELKVHDDVKLLIKAMRYIMRELPVVQITHSKLELS